MTNLCARVLAVAAVVGVSAPAAALAQTPPAPAATVAVTTAQTVCNLPIPAPAALPPAGSEPVIYQIVPCFPQQGNVSNVEPET